MQKAPKNAKKANGNRPTDQPTNQHSGLQIRVHATKNSGQCKVVRLIQINTARKPSAERSGALSGGQEIYHIYLIIDKG